MLRNAGLPPNQSWRWGETFTESEALKKHFEVYIIHLQCHSVHLFWGHIAVVNA